MISVEILLLMLKYMRHSYFFLHIYIFSCIKSDWISWTLKLLGKLYLSALCVVVKIYGQLTKKKEHISSNEEERLKNRRKRNGGRLIS